MLFSASKNVHNARSGSDDMIGQDAKYPVDQNDNPSDLDESYSHVEQDRTLDLMKLFQVKKRLNFDDM